MIRRPIILFGVLGVVTMLLLLASNWNSTQDVDDPASSPLPSSHSVKNDGRLRNVIHHDFGLVYPGEAVTHAFLIKNSASAPLNFQGIRTTCGCTTTGEVPRIIEPGQQGEVKVTFNPGSNEAVIRKSTFLDIVGGGAIELSFTATVRPRARVIPSRIEERCLPGSKDLEYSAVVENWTDTVWQDFSVKTAMDWLDCRLVRIPLSKSDSQPVEAWRLVIRVSRSLAVGHHRGFVCAATSNGEKLFDFPVFLTVIHPIRVFPDRFFLGNVDVRSSSRATVRVIVDAKALSANMKTPELILQSRSDSLTFALRQESAGLWNIDCEFVAGSGGELFRSSVVLSVAGDPATQLEIPVVASVVEGVVAQ